jgi:hypothetical protein
LDDAVMHNTLIVDSREACSRNRGSGLQSKAPIFAEAGGVCWIEGTSTVCNDGVQVGRDRGGRYRACAVGYDAVAGNNGITRGAVGVAPSLGPSSVLCQGRLARGLLRPSTGVRRSLNSGHEINRWAQCRLVPTANTAIVARSIRRQWHYTDLARTPWLRAAGNVRSQGGVTFRKVIEHGRYARSHDRVERQRPHPHRDGRLTANDRDTQWFFPMQYAGVVM